MFSKNLQFLRTKHGQTQEQLAEQLSVSRQSVSKWESGTSFPEMDTILKLCDMYQISLDTLLRGDAEAEAAADTTGYHHFMSAFAWKISLAVGGIIFAVALAGLLYTLGLHEMFCGFLLLTMIAAAVVVLIAAGIQEENFRRRHPYVTDFYSEEEREQFHNRSVFLIAGAVGAILLGVALMILTFALVPEREPWESLVGCLFLFLISGAVTVLVWTGITDEKYKIEKYNRECNPSEDDQKRDERVGRICGTIMLLATAIYVGLGFTKNLWGSVWWVFPVGGILCAIINVALGPTDKD